MQEIIGAIAQVAQAADTAGPADQQLNLPLVTPEVEAGGTRFTDLLSVEIDQPTVYAADPSILRLENAASPNTLGEQILARLDKVGNEFRINMERTHKLLEVTPANLNLGELLKLQLEVAQISLEIELVGKGVSKAVQHVDQLTRLQ